MVRCISDWNSSRTRRLMSEPSTPRLSRSGVSPTTARPSPAFTAKGKPVFEMKGGQSPAVEASVLDIVVNQESVVEQLDGGGRWHRLLGRAAEGPAGCNAQTRADALADPGGISGHEVVEPAARLAVGEVAGHRRGHQLAVGGQRLLYEACRRSRHRSSWLPTDRRRPLLLRSSCTPPAGW